MGGCSHPSIEDLGIVFEIEEVGNFSWNIVRYRLWHYSLYQDLATGCESVSHPKCLSLTLIWKIVLVHPFQPRGCWSLSRSATMEPTPSLHSASLVDDLSDSHSEW